MAFTDSGLLIKMDVTMPERVIPTARLVHHYQDIYPVETQKRQIHSPSSGSNDANAVSIKCTEGLRNRCLMCKIGRNKFRIIVL